MSSDQRRTFAIGKGYYASDITKKCFEKRGTVVKVYSCHTVGCHCYLLETEQSCVLIDTGTVVDYAAILLAINHTKQQRLDAIFITHSHKDHVGNVERLTNKYDCKAYISPIGNEEMLEHDEYEPISQLIVLTYLGSGAKLICTPGHSSDSISISIGENFVFVGDAVTNQFGMIFSPFCKDINQVHRSIKRLLMENSKVYYPGHGKAITFGILLKAFKQRKM